MRIQEALEIFENVRPQGNRIINEALNTIKTAVKKQIPKKPKTYLVNMKHIDFLCPNCKKRIISKVDGEWFAGKNQKFCDECGQAIDWSVEE